MCGEGNSGAVFGSHEALGYGSVELGQKRVKEPLGVEQPARFMVEAELSPGDDFTEFVQGAETTRQGDEGVTQIRHEGLAFVHGMDDVQLSDSVVGQFAVDQRLWDDADHLTFVFEYRVGEDTHESDIPAAVDEAERLFGH